MTTPHFVRPPHHELPRGSRFDGIGHDAARTPVARPSTAPAGLFAPAPEVIREKVARRWSKPPQTGNLARQRPCGSETAAKRHKRNGEVDTAGQITCAECLAGREARRVTKRAPASRPTVAKQRCGTRYGYDDHLKRGEETCPACRDAMAAYNRSRYIPAKSITRKPPTDDPRCGSTAGRSAHRRRGELACTSCKAAVNAAARQVTARNAA